MIPKLYDTFDVKNGNGPIDFLGKITHCITCKVNETRNNDYTLDLETTVNDPTASNLISQRIIAIKPNPHDPVQHFEINDTDRSTKGIVKASAVHVKNFAYQSCSRGNYDWTGQTVGYELTPRGWWNKLFNDHLVPTPFPFTFNSDLTTSWAYCTLGFNAAVSLGDILGGAEGSMLDLYDGEYHYDNYLIEFLRSRGKDTNYSLKYGKNIDAARQKENCLQAYSHILPYGSVTNTEGVEFRFSAYLYEIPGNECKTEKTLPLDCSEALKNFKIENTSQSYERGRALMTDYAAKYAETNGLGKTKVSIEVTARADLDSMLQLGLCDTVKVVLDDFGTTTRAKITSVTYDALLERWDKMTVGSFPVNLTDVILNKRRYNL